MRKAFLHSLRILTVLCFTFVISSVVQGQAPRTWVSGVGDDLNPCSRTAPCKTFAGALSKTFINGEIDCLDPGGFGAVTIAKSISIDCSGTFGSILASGAQGVTVNLTDVSGNDPLHTVRLRGLSINGTGASGTIGTRTGLNGIRVLTGSGTAPNVVVEDTLIEGFSQDGIVWTANGGSLDVRNCSIRDNAQRGIFVDSGGASLVHVTVDKTHTDLNQQGIRFNDNVRGTIRDSTSSRNTLNGYVCFPDGTGSSEMNIDLSAANDNLQFGVAAFGTGASIGTIRITGVEITNNVTQGVNIGAGGAVVSNGKNHITAPTMTPPATFTDQ